MLLSQIPAPDGYVYLIAHHERRAVKIGHSRHPYRRMKQIQTSVADVLSLMGEIPGDRSLEAAFHQHFASCRLHGEWFDDTGGVVSGFFKNLEWETLMGRGVLE